MDFITGKRGDERTNERSTTGDLILVKVGWCIACCNETKNALYIEFISLCLYTCEAISFVILLQVIHEELDTVAMQGKRIQCVWQVASHCNGVAGWGYTRPCDNVRVEVRHHCLIYQIVYMVRQTHNNHGIHYTFQIYSTVQVQRHTHPWVSIWKLKRHGTYFAHDYSSCYKRGEYLRVKWVFRPFN